MLFTKSEFALGYKIFVSTGIFRGKNMSNNLFLELVVRLRFTKNV